MKSILEQIYKGEFSIDDYLPITSPAYQHSFDQLVATENYLREVLSPENYQKVEELEQFSSEIAYLEDLATFCCGVKLGAKLMQEIACTNTENY